jgi:hypothetical protein
MLSQLIVIDFTGGQRKFSFGEFSGAHDSAVSHVNSRPLADEMTYLFNYDRYHSNRTLLQVVFLFASSTEAEFCHRANPDPKAQAFCQRIEELALRYRALTSSRLSVVKYDGWNTLCEFSSTEHDLTLSNQLDWLTCPMTDLPDPPGTDA